MGKRKEEGTETIQLIVQCPGSANDFILVLVLHDALYMLHCCHQEQQSS
jgi:hypothetical protein